MTLVSLAAPIAPENADSLFTILADKLNAGEYSRRGADTCLACHSGEDNHPPSGLFRGAHGHPAVVGSPFYDGSGLSSSDVDLSPVGLQCEACHGPIGKHGLHILEAGDRREPMIGFPARQGGRISQLQDFMCLECHDDQERAGWSGGNHADGNVTCTDCHSIHSLQDPALNRTQQVDVCTTCHTAVGADIQKQSAHPLHPSLIAGNPMVCNDCHSAHDSEDTSGTALFGGNASCTNCHGEQRGPFLWEHAPVSEDCSICHLPHGSNQPALLVRRPPQLCQGCHSSAGHRSLALSPDELVGGAPSEYLLGGACLNCHSFVHGSNHPSGNLLGR